MKLKSHLITQTVGDEHMLVAAMEKQGDFHGIVKLSETAAFIVECLREETTEEEILEKLKQRYRGDEALMREDIRKCVAALASRGLLEGGVA